MKLRQREKKPPSTQIFTLIKSELQSSQQTYPKEIPWIAWSDVLWIFSSVIALPAADKRITDIFTQF